MLRHLVSLSLGLFVAAQAQSLLVLNKGANTLVVLDAATLKIKGSVPSGPDPHEVIASPDGHVAWISNYMRGNGAANTLTVADLVNLKPLPIVNLGALSRPHGLTFADGKLWFTAEGAKVIGRYDPSTNAIDWVMGTGQDRTHMIIVANDGQRVYTSNVASATVCIIEQKEMRPMGPPPGGGPPPGAGPPPGGPPRFGPMKDWEVTVLPVGAGAEGFDLSPDGRQLWVANAHDGSVSIIDTAAKKTIDTVKVPFHAANRLKFTPDGRRVFISDLGGDQVFVLDTGGRRLVKTITVGRGPAGILMDPGGTRAFIAVNGENGVAVVDLSTLAVTSRVATGPNPDGLAWAQ